MSNEPLWPRGELLPFIGVSGKISTGKTLFCLTICPESTLCFDLEQSSATYEGLGVKRVDVPAMLAAAYPRGSSLDSLWAWWKKAVIAIEPNKYSVIVVDPADDLEVSLEAYVRSRYKEYG